MLRKNLDRRANAPVTPSDSRSRDANDRRNLASTSRSPEVADGEREFASWDGFETEAAAIAEDAQRLRRLTWHLGVEGKDGLLAMHPKLSAAIKPLQHLKLKALAGRPVAALAKKLRGTVEYDEPSTSLASMVAMRRTRMCVVGNMIEAFKDYHDSELCVATVIKTTWTFTQKGLVKARAKKIKQQFRNDLLQAGILAVPGPLIAFLHGGFDSVAGVYVVHWHVLTTTEKGNALHRLKHLPGYTQTHSGAAPVFVQGVKNRERQFSYLLKSMWLDQPFRPETGKRDREPHRIPEPCHSLYLLWLDREVLPNITLMNECWSLRKGGSAAMRDLYLSIHPGRGKARLKV